MPHLTLTSLGLYSTREPTNQSNGPLTDWLSLGIQFHFMWTTKILRYYSSFSTFMFRVLSQLNLRNHLLLQLPLHPNVLCYSLWESHRLLRYYGPLPGPHSTASFPPPPFCWDLHNNSWVQKHTLEHHAQLRHVIAAHYTGLDLHCRGISFSLCSFWWRKKC